MEQHEGAMPDSMTIASPKQKNIRNNKGAVIKPPAKALFQDTHVDKAHQKVAPTKQSPLQQVYILL